MHQKRRRRKKKKNQIREVGKEPGLVIQISKSQKLSKVFLPWALWPALKGSKNFRKMFTIIQVSESLTSISDIERQRCSVLALSNMGGAVSIFWSDSVVVFKTEDFL